MLNRPLRFVTFLAPNMYPVYEYITRQVGACLDWPTELAVGDCYDELADPPDVSFVCGLAYVDLARRAGQPSSRLPRRCCRGRAIAAGRFIFRT